jgi:pepF/M3 family oligoendopeptidase
VYRILLNANWPRTHGQLAGAPDAAPGASATLPRWDVSGVYPGLDSPEFAAGFRSVLERIDALAERFDALGVGTREPGPVDDAQRAAVDGATGALNAALEAVDEMEAYLMAFVSTDSRDEAAQARYSELRQRGVLLSQLRTRYVAWVGKLDLEELARRSEVVRRHAFALEQMRVEARHHMSMAEEALAAELHPVGGGGWERLWYDVTSQITVRLDPEGDGNERELPLAEVENLSRHPERSVRERAHDAELQAWAANAVPLAAAMNGVKGETNTLAARRGWASPLEQALHDARIDRATLDAMLAAMRAAFPNLRRYLRAKARALGVPTLAWYDRFAPLRPEGGSPNGHWQYEPATAFIAEHFGSYSDRLRGLAERAFNERWIDAEPRVGKEGGGFCMRLRDGESRILVNYEPSYTSMSTVAHELGHAYHNLCLKGLAPLERETPHTLAETASILCETIVQRAALDASDAAGRLEILESSLQRDAGVVVEVTSRFLFEQAVLERRRERDLSVSELNELMLQTQRETYGDGLDPDALHPYMWAARPHYYGYLFYNYPYAFGLLFALGLYRRYEEDPEAFRADYDDLLRSTGAADAASLAARFGADIRDPGFWEAGLDVIRADVDRFEALVDGR